VRGSYTQLQSSKAFYHAVPATHSYNPAKHFITPFLLLVVVYVSNQP
jgi:hypothetical protein